MSSVSRVPFACIEVAMGKCPFQIRKCQESLGTCLHLTNTIMTIDLLPVSHAVPSTQDVSQR